MPAPATCAPRSLAIDAALRAFLAPDADPAQCFARLFDALRPRPGRGAHGDIELMLGAVEAHPAYRAALRSRFFAFFDRRRQVDFFADSGILASAGFLPELARRITERVLPPVRDRASLKDAVGIVFHGRHDLAWLNALPEALNRRFWAIVQPVAGPDAGLPRNVTEQMLEALLVVSHRVSALGLEPELARNHPDLLQRESPFIAQSVEAARFVDGCRRALDDPASPHEDERHLVVLVEQCRAVLTRVRRTALTRGASLSLTYLLVRLWQSLRRIEALAAVLGAQFRPAAADAAAAQWSDLMRTAFRAELERGSVRRHFTRLVGLLALRVTDNAAQTGEHYVAETRSQYAAMWRSAMGAGLIIAVMALDKIFAAKLGWAPLNQAFVYSMNYALGFVLIYLLHCTVATKQPAMTAQTIAASVSEDYTARGDLGRIVDLVAAVARTQLAAILGNVTVALPTALALGWALGARKGAPFVDAEKAHALLADLDPLRSLALLHAAVAGVWLFVSGLISGWVDNWTVYERVPERIARLGWLRALLGVRRAQAFAGYVGRNLGGIAGNFLFGVMLGSTGAVAALFGLPIDIRHIAFAAANLGYALVALGFALPWPEIAWCALGVALIGMVNLGVSFALALWMALRARGAEFRRTGELLRLLGREALARPGRFFLPPRASTSAPA
ncbi:MAG: site-specific recombinase [Burkholderiales bacterium]